MEFVGEKCYLCNKKLGKKKPVEVTMLDKSIPSPDPADEFRMVEAVAPCPFCGENIPVWGELEPSTPEPEPAE
ncbi:hypothetical protein ES703_123187 [subsurface metagenome]